MIFSRACEYGLRAMLYLASRDENTPILVRDIAGHLRVPFPFLAKIVQTLVRRRLLGSQKGPGGGVFLARPAGEIVLLEVVEAIDGLDLTRSCALGLPNCDDEHPCPLHEEWGAIRHQIVEMLEHQSLGKFAEQLNRRDYVLVRV